MKFFCQLLITTILVATVSLSHAQDLTDIGGDLTSTDFSFNALQLPAPNIGSQEEFNRHLLSHQFFHRSFDGRLPDRGVILGPRFNNVSCAGCHVNVGRGHTRFSQSIIPGSSMLIKVSRRGLATNGAPRNVPGIGEQLRDLDIKGNNYFNIRLRWRGMRGQYDDGTSYSLRRPILSFDIPGVNLNNIVHSLRHTPSVVGMGLLDAVPDETISALSDPADLDGDGISGKLSLVPNRETGQFEIGRFGHRATHPTLRQQTAAAFFFDMGITNDVFQGRKNVSELTTTELAETVFYQQAATIPAARNQDDPNVIAGKALFQSLNCSSCHRLTLQTGPSDVPAIANQEFHPFTDLLLHDMGKGLADTRPEFSAKANEWRTAPLWGIGITETLIRNGRFGFLHDGRARTIEEAILWHGGEARPSRDAFKALSATEREQLLAFLRSI